MQKVKQIVKKMLGLHVLVYVIWISPNYWVTITVITGVGTSPPAGPITGTVSDSSVSLWEKLSEVLSHHKSMPMLIKFGSMKESPLP